MIDFGGFIFFGSFVLLSIVFSLGFLALLVWSITTVLREVFGIKISYPLIAAIIVIICWLKPNTLPSFRKTSKTEIID